MLLSNNCIGTSKEKQKDINTSISEHLSDQSIENLITELSVPCKECNKTDKKGQKHGFWIEVDYQYTKEIYYRNGLKNGIVKQYHPKSQKLSYFYEYINDKLTGIWYRFDDIGRINMVLKDFSTNTDTVFLYDDKKYVFPNRAYCICYYPNGLISNEGILLWNDSPEMDDAREYGEWKFYNEEGKLVRTKEFKQ